MFYAVCSRGHTTNCETLKRLLEQKFKKMFFPGGPAYWSDWSEFSDCSATCGSDAYKTRYRVCQGVGLCEGPAIERVQCPYITCGNGKIVIAHSHYPMHGPLKKVVSVKSILFWPNFQTVQVVLADPFKEAPAIIDLSLP